MANKKTGTYTGHKNTKMPDGKTLVEWITPIVEEECRFFNVHMPSKKQMAVVVSALRMHGVMTYAAEYDYSELGKPDEKTRFWPTESSIGRYFRDASRETLEAEDEQR